MKIKRSYPETRMRRLEQSSIREMLTESSLSKSDLIQPIFIKEDLDGKEEIATMPGINRLGMDILNEEVKKIIDVGIKSIAVFPVINDDKKDEDGSEALKEDNFIFKAISSLKKNFPNLISGHQRLLSA